MAIVVLERLPPEPGGTRARFRHGESTFDALLGGDVSSVPSSELLFEMAYGSIADVRPAPGFVDESSAIFPGEDGTIVVRGRVHQVLPAEEDWLIDLYLMNGPEFFLFRASDARIEPPEVGAGVEVVVRGLEVLLSSSKRHHEMRPIT